MNRRKMLAMMMALAACGSARPALAEGRSSRQRRQIVVIGAGLAGLAAARALQDDDNDVVVIEARDRIGGRVWTSHAWPDAPMDLGASWIHGVDGNPLTELADEADLRRLETRYARAATYGTSGGALDEAEAERLDALRTRLHEALEQAQQADQDVSVREAVGPVMQAIADDPALRRYIDFILSSDIEQEYAGSAASLSAHWYDHAEGFDGGDVLFPDGFGAMAEYLAADLDVVQGQVVQAIDWSGTRVRVVTQDAEYEAEQVLVTVPLGVLKAGSIRFTPDLPAAKQAAIDALGMGVLNKCYLRFEAPFWPQDADWLEYIPATHGAWTQWVSFWRAARKPVLLGFNAADQGRAIEALSDEHIVDSAMQTLRAMFGPRIPDPVGHQLTRWARDPFAHGAYSYNPVGSTPRLRKALAAPLAGRVHFAGEATHAKHYGTAHGAYLSGLIAARAIQAS